jgi:O-antigen ligase
MTPIDTIAPPKRPKWDALLLVLTLLVFFQVWRVQGLVPRVPLLGLPVLCTVVALLLLSLDRDPRRRLHSLNHPVVRAVLGIVVLVMASIPGSLYPSLSLSFLLMDYLRAVILMILIAASIRGLADLRRLAWVQVVGVTLCSTAIVATSQMGSEGRLSTVAYYDVNDLAMLIVCTLPLIVYLWQRPTGPFGRVGLAAATVFLLRTLGQTGSRGGFLGFVAVGGYLLLRFHGISGAKRVGAVALLVILLGVFASDRYFERIETILHPSADYNWSGKSETGRMDIWKRGLGYMLEHPAFGVGAANFEKAEGTLAPQARQRQQYGRSFQWSTAHNSFIQIGAEIGVGGVILFSALLIGAFRALSAARRGPPGEARVLAQILTGSLVAYVVTASLLSQAYSAYLYALLGMVLGLAKVASPAGAGRPPARPAPGPSIWGPSRVASAFPVPGGLRRDAR